MSSSGGGKSSSNATPSKSKSGGTSNTKKSGTGTSSASPSKRKIGAALAEKAKYTKPPFIQSWDAFEREARRLFQRNPNNTRMFSKYRATEKFMEVKVTDDVKCIKFLITEQADIYELEKLNLWFLQAAIETGPVS